MEIFQYELLIAGGIIGIVVGSLGTTYWLSKQIKELKSIILDKRMIVNLLKQALREVRPKKTYKKKYTSNKRNGKPSTKTVTKTVKS
jgi:L-asparaginase/Glu-tRNA(Gln) amidotransferase subunit D